MLLLIGIFIISIFKYYSSNKNLDSKNFNRSNIDQILNSSGNRLQTDISQNYDDRKKINASAMQAISKAMLNSEKFDIRVLEASMIFLNDEKQAINLRNQISHSNFFQKKFLALKMLLLNYYKHFNGIKSFARDMIR